MSDIPGRRRAPMSRERWVRLAPLVDEALDLPPDERPAYCERASGGDSALGSELLRLIRQADTGDGLLSAAAVERFALLFDDEPAGADLMGRLQASLGDAYRLTREIGGGGMSRVFIAAEPGLGRTVVIKVLSPELTAGVNADRFAREIRLVASLQQANIVPLLSAGVAAGFPYYTMPLVEGRSLRERLARDGALPIGDAVSILRDVARALAFAHARGVVHRDIKPGNVLLSGGTAVVTDFGIAKAIAAAHGEAGEPADAAPRASGSPEPADMTLTQAGATLGTPAYMAPEQALGDPTTDHRADLYAFGCLAFEIFTGTPPFHGAPVHRIIAAHLNETPVALKTKRADVPPAIAQLVSQCLEKDPARRPQTATEVLRVLDGGETAVRARRLPGGRRQIVAASVVVASAAIVATKVFGHHPPSEPVTIGAVPFTTKTNDAALADRSDGMSDEILTGMARVPGIHIIGRLAAYRFKQRDPGDAPLDTKAIARALGVRFLVTGMLTESNGRVTVSAQLNDSTLRSEVWAGSFVRGSQELAAIADDVVRTITDTLRARVGDRIGTLPRDKPTTGTASDEAFSAFLEGQRLMKGRGSGVAESVERFEHAIALDPTFARAHAALATALQLYPHFAGPPPARIRDRSVAAAREALRLDPTLADAHVALGSAFAFDGDWAASDAEFKQAITLEADNVAARQAYARFLVLRGEANAALAQLDRARELERQSALNSAWRSYAEFMLGHVDSALAENAEAIRLDSTMLATTNLGALVDLSLGRYDAARRLMSTVPPVGMMTNAPYVWAKLGDTAKANALIRAMESNNPRPWFTDVSRATVQLAEGDSAGALASLDRSAQTTGPEWTMFIPLADPAYDPVRRSPRFVDLIRKAKLDPGTFGRSVVRR